MRETRTTGRKGVSSAQLKRPGRKRELTMSCRARTTKSERSQHTGAPRRVLPEPRNRSSESIERAGSSFLLRSRELNTLSRSFLLSFPLCPSYLPRSLLFEHPAPSKECSASSRVYKLLTDLYKPDSIAQIARQARHGRDPFRFQFRVQPFTERPIRRRAPIQ